jgi:hypothetical protein
MEIAGSVVKADSQSGQTDHNECALIKRSRIPSPFSRAIHASSTLGWRDERDGYQNG